MVTVTTLLCSHVLQQSPADAARLPLQFALVTLDMNAEDSQSVGIGF